MAHTMVWGHPPDMAKDETMIVMGWFQERRGWVVYSARGQKWTLIDDGSEATGTWVAAE